MKAAIIILFYPILVFAEDYDLVPLNAEKGPTLQNIVAQKEGETAAIFSQSFQGTLHGYDIRMRGRNGFLAGKFVFKDKQIVFLSNERGHKIPIAEVGESKLTSEDYGVPESYFRLSFLPSISLVSERLRSNGEYSFLLSEVLEGAVTPLPHESFWRPVPAGFQVALGNLVVSSTREGEVAAFNHRIEEQLFPEELNYRSAMGIVEGKYRIHKNKILFFPKGSTDGVFIASIFPEVHHGRGELAYDAVYWKIEFNPAVSLFEENDRAYHRYSLSLETFTALQTEGCGPDVLLQAAD